MIDSGDTTALSGLEALDRVMVSPTARERGRVLIERAMSILGPDIPPSLLPMGQGRLVLRWIVGDATVEVSIPGSTTEPLALRTTTVPASCGAIADALQSLAGACIVGGHPQ